MELVVIDCHAVADLIAFERSMPVPYVGSPNYDAWIHITCRTWLLRHPSSVRGWRRCWRRNELVYGWKSWEVGPSTQLVRSIARKLDRL